MKWWGGEREGKGKAKRHENQGEGGRLLSAQDQDG
jgi:hypothetical protein